MTLQTMAVVKKSQSPASLTLKFSKLQLNLNDTIHNDKKCYLHISTLRYNLHVEILHLGLTMETVREVPIQLEHRIKLLMEKQ